MTLFFYVWSFYYDGVTSKQGPTLMRIKFSNSVMAAFVLSVVTIIIPGPVISEAAHPAVRPALQQAAKHFRANRDYASLKIISQHLAVGMSHRMIEKLLGKADYSPTDGLYYYSAKVLVFIKKQNRYTARGLVVDYRDENGNTTMTLKKYFLQNLGE